MLNNQLKNLKNSNEEFESSSDEDNSDDNSNTKCNQNITPNIYIKQKPKASNDNLNDGCKLLKFKHFSSDISS